VLVNVVKDAAQSDPLGASMDCLIRSTVPAKTDKPKGFRKIAPNSLFLTTFYGILEIVFIGKKWPK